MMSETLDKIKSSSKKEHVLAVSLAKLLSDTYMLALKTQNFHWNVEGTQFYHLHLMFEAQYNDLQTAVDVIAERIRALGVYSPGSFAEFSKYTVVEELPGEALNSQQMVKALLKDHETIAKELRTMSEKSSNLKDPATTALIDDRGNFHEKTAWMLRSLILQ